MNVLVFTGPTIDAAQARDVLAAEYRPPARVGHVLAAALTRPEAIVIIDGLFDSVPAIWHKEILFALSCGIHVYGASSMGALRAAELHTFGMVGVGRIFEMYRDGVLEDDDEVAVVYSMPAGGTVVQSEALVNIREGLAQAVHAGAIGAATEQSLMRLAKAFHYPDRSWPAVLSQARDRGGVPAAELMRLREFVVTHDTNLKRADALEVLRRVAADASRGFIPFQPSFTFERTSLFEALRETVAILDSGEAYADVLNFVAESADGPALERNALLLALAAAEIRRQGIELPIAERLDQETRFLTDRGLSSPASVVAWLADNHLSVEGFVEMVYLEACVARLLRDRGAALDRYLLAELRRDGRLARVLESFNASRAT